MFWCCPQNAEGKIPALGFGMGDQRSKVRTVDAGWFQHLSEWLQGLLWPCGLLRQLNLGPGGVTYAWPGELPDGRRHVSRSRAANTTCPPRFSCSESVAEARQFGALQKGIRQTRSEAETLPGFQPSRPHGLHTRTGCFFPPAICACH